MSENIVYIQGIRNLSPARALKIIKEVALDSSRVFFVRHAEKRMKQRRISRTQVLRCLRNGYISEGPFHSQHGNWECTVEGMSAGQRIGVELAIETDENGNNIIVITVMVRG